LQHWKLELEQVPPQHSESKLQDSPKDRQQTLFWQSALKPQQSDPKLQVPPAGVQQKLFSQRPWPQQSQSLPEEQNVPGGRQHLVENPAVLVQAAGSQTALKSQHSSAD